MTFHEIEEEDLNSLRKDALQEIFNISMGQAADSLASLVKDRVHLYFYIHGYTRSMVMLISPPSSPVSSTPCLGLPYA